MPFTYIRTIHLQDTDAAGVVYFANVLVMCHEAYEASLVASGVHLKSFFSNAEMAIPITHASVSFFRPMFCGDQQLIRLTPKQLSEHQFEISYEFALVETPDPVLSKALTQHTCIHPTNRTRTELSASMLQWLQQWG